MKVQTMMNVDFFAFISFLHRYSVECGFMTIYCFSKIEFEFCAVNTYALWFKTS